jgi:hypothetical protein
LEWSGDKENIWESIFTVTGKVQEYSVVYRWFSKVPEGTIVGLTCPE